MKSTYAVVVAIIATIALSFTASAGADLSAPSMVTPDCTVGAPLNTGSTSLTLSGSTAVAQVTGWSFCGETMTDQINWSNGAVSTNTTYATLALAAGQCVSIKAHIGTASDGNTWEQDAGPVCAPSSGGGSSGGSGGSGGGSTTVPPAALPPNTSYYFDTSGGFTNLSRSTNGWICGVAHVAFSYKNKITSYLYFRWQLSETACWNGVKVTAVYNQQATSLKAQYPWDFDGNVTQPSTGGVGTYFATTAAQGKYEACVAFGFGCVMSVAPWAKITVSGAGAASFQYGVG